MNSIRFMNETLDKVDAVIDVGQVGLIRDDKLYVHTLQNESDGGYERYFRAAAAASTTDLNVTFEYVEPDPERGVPPSSALAFDEVLDENESVPIFVLADHAGAFHNKHYMSHRDRSIRKDGLCDAATLLTRTLYRLAFEDEVNRSATSGSNDNEIAADCELVEQLAECLTDNFKCPIAENLLGNMTTSDGSEEIRISRYTNIYGSSDKSLVVGTIQRFIRLFTLRYAPMDIAGTNCSLMDDCPTGYECVGYNDNGTCVYGITEYHSAVSLGVQYKGDKWKITDKTQPLWAES